MTNVYSAHAMASQAQPIVVYDTTQKKPVLVFDSIASCERYITGVLPSRGRGAAGRHLVSKTVMNQNRFGRPICFRLAKPEQAALLKGRKQAVLDERFRIAGMAV